MPTHASALLKQLSVGEPLTASKRLKIARFVLQTRESYIPPELPGRPVVIALEDHELVEEYRKRDAGVTIGADKRRQLGYFGRWRAAVRFAEMEGGMRLLTLLDAAIVLQGADLVEDADTILVFAEEKYRGFKVDNLPASLPPHELRDWCMVVARDYELLPNHLRTMVWPRGGAAPASWRRSEAEPDEDQESLPWE